MDPRICTRDLYEICFGTSYVNDFVRGHEKNRHHLMEAVSWPTGHDNARIKTLGKLKERWSVKPTKRCVVAVNQIWYLICNLINIKSGKISMFSGQVGENLMENDKETQWQKPAWVLCLFGGNCALTPQTNGTRSSFPSTQPQSTVQYVTWWWWSPIKASSFCNLSTPGVPCSSPPWVNYPIFAASSFIFVRLIRFSSDL